MREAGANHWPSTFALLLRSIVFNQRCVALFQKGAVQVIGEGVTERPGLFMSRGMYEHSRRLVDDYDVVVFVDYIERNLFGRHGRLALVVKDDFNRVARTQVIAGGG